MIEFTLSRVTLCMVGIILMGASVGAVSGSYDNDTDQMDKELVDRIAMMLDTFESSQMDVLVLEGSQVLPDGCSLHVHDNRVELYSGDLIHTAVTDYPGEFTLDCNGAAEITRRTSQLSS